MEPRDHIFASILEQNNNAFQRSPTGLLDSMFQEYPNLESANLGTSETLEMSGHPTYRSGPSNQGGQRYSQETAT